MPMSILVVAAHPDDEVLGAGATIARLAKDGHDVHVAILGEGVTSRFDAREAADKALIHALRGQVGKVAEELGAASVETFDFPDNRFDTVPLLDVIKVVERLVQRLSPEVVYTHHPGDLNVDHQTVSRAVLTATRPTAGQPVRELYAFEIASSTEWGFQLLPPAFVANTFVDVSATLEKKLAAMRIYEAESRPFPHPRSSEALTAIARRWGSVVGCGAAEAFQAIRVLR
jgi:LmbE family N-acetylglucosaminyl deacetylase